MKKWLKRVPLILVLAAFMLIVGAFLREFDRRELVIIVLGATAAFLTLLAYWLWREQR